MAPEPEPEPGAMPPEREMQVADSLLDLVGNTPLVRLGRVGAHLQCDLLAKVELFNPGGSVKDRPAVAMIDAAERDGLLLPGGVIVEPTSGNTGVGLAIVAAQRGYRCIFVMSDKMSNEKVALLRAYGADVVVCPTAVPPEHPDSYYSVADRLTRETPGAFRPDQYSNQANPIEHERSTGPEIWAQTAGRVTHFVAGIGTGGTITGVARALKAQNPNVQIIGADPEGSVYSGGTGRPYLVEGVGEDFWPTTYDPSVVDRTVMVTDAESFAAARRVTREEGLLIGGSCGTAVHAALVVGAELGPDDVVVVLLPDSGRNYLSKIFDDDWMTRYGFVRSVGVTAGDVLAAKDDSIPELVVITDDVLGRDAFARMRELGVSQLVVAVSTEPPLAAKEISGMVSELPLMDRAFRDGHTLDLPVRDLMEPAPPMVGVGESVSDVVERLERCTAVLVLDGGHPVGVLTRSDVLTFLAAAGAHVTDRFETRAIHTGQEPDPTSGAVVPPLSLSSTFAQSAVGEHSGFEYARSANPTRQAYEECLASLEGAARGFAFASGMAAEDAILRTLVPGDRVLLPNDAYGGTFRLVSKVLAPTGLEWGASDLTDIDALASHWVDGTRMVWVESPTNPALTVVDIAAVCEVAHARDAIVVVDNTFATPYLQQPLAFGADVVVHSATKYLGGHSDVVGGFAATSDPDLAERIGFLQNATGAVASPFDCYLVLRGVKTLAVRMDRHCTNARAVAALLAAHPAVSRVLYPGVPTHPGHDVAKRQMQGFGGMVSFIAAAGEDAALEIVANTRLFTLAESLGGVESLIEHPARMTHASVADSPLAVDPALVRVSVGIEHVDDLLADLQQALDNVV